MTRAGLAESWHFGAAAAVTPDGRLVAKIGDPGVETYLRSGAKPFQALPLVLDGGVERWQLADADLAVICGSHQGTEAHTSRVEALLARAGLACDDLGCGPHWPYSAASRRRLRARGAEPGREHNNCSGKHAGMLLACRQAGYPLEGYLSMEHPLQRRILALVGELCRVDPERIGIGVDGCAAPCFRLPLAAAARGYAALADPAGAGLDAPLAAAARRIVGAMTAAPEMVAGPGTFTTRLIEATGGRVLGKEGAEGSYSLAVRGPVALGVVVKIADGGERARPGVVLDVLRQLGALAAAELAELADLRSPPLTNASGAEIGRIVPEVELEEAGEPGSLA